MYLSIWNYVQTLWERWFRSRSVTNNLFIWMNLVWVTIVCSDIWTFVPEAATCCYSAEDCSVRWHRQTSSAKKELFVLSTLVRHWRKRVNASLRAVQFQWERRRWGSCNAWGWQLRSCIPKFFATWYYMLPFPVLEWTSWLEWLCFNILKLFCVVVSYLDTDFQHVSSVCVGRLKRLAGGHGVQSGTMSNEAAWLYGIQSLINSAYLRLKWQEAKQGPQNILSCCFKFKRGNHVCMLTLSVSMFCLSVCINTGHDNSDRMGSL